MTITLKQTFVLDNLALVRRTPYKLNVKWKREPFELHGSDCTGQITSLVVKGFIRQDASGRYVRCGDVTPSASQRSAELCGSLSS